MDKKYVEVAFKCNGTNCYVYEKKKNMSRMKFESRQVIDMNYGVQTVDEKKENRTKRISIRMLYEVTGVFHTAKVNILISLE